jgi:hypothetical protein
MSLNVSPIVQSIHSFELFVCSSFSLILSRHSHYSIRLSVPFVVFRSFVPYSSVVALVRSLVCFIHSKERSAIERVGKNCLHQQLADLHLRIGIGRQRKRNDLQSLHFRLSIEKMLSNQGMNYAAREAFSY